MCLAVVRQAGVHDLKSWIYHMRGRMFHSISVTEQLTGNVAGAYISLVKTGLLSIIPTTQFPPVCACITTSGGTAAGTAAGALVKIPSTCKHPLVWKKQ